MCLGLYGLSFMATDYNLLPSFVAFKAMNLTTQVYMFQKGHVHLRPECVCIIVNRVSSSWGGGGGGGGTEGKLSLQTP